MGRFIKDTYLRPATTDVERVQRGMLLNRARVQRAEIEQQFRDVEHWNSLHPDEEPIDADPDGTLRQLAAELDELLAANQGVQ